MNSRHFCWVNSMKDRKKPAIRFKGFTEDWEQRKLGEICQVTMGQSPDGSTYSETPSDYILVQGNADLKDGWVSPRIWTTQKTKTADAGDLIMSVRAPAGAMGKTTYNVVIGRGVAGIKGNEYIYQYLVKMDLDSYWKKLASGSTFESIKSEDINRAEFMMPRDIDEQDRIGEYFCNLNHIITLHQRKYDKLVNIKKSMLEKMFPREGKNIPDIRFSGFTEDWEQRKVNEICSISTGKSNTQDKIDDGKYPFYVRSPIIERSNRYLYDEEAVLTVGDGVGTGKVFHYVNGKYDIHQRVYRLFDFSDDIDAKFFYHWFSKNFYNRVMYMTAKTSVDSVRLEMIADMEITAPSYDEQKKISSYLDNFDNLITLHQRKLEKLKNIKKSCLEKMFI